MKRVCLTVVLSSVCVTGAILATGVSRDAASQEWAEPTSQTRNVQPAQWPYSPNAAQSTRTQYPVPQPSSDAWQMPPQRSVQQNVGQQDAVQRPRQRPLNRRPVQHVGAWNPQGTSNRGTIHRDQRVRFAGENSRNASAPSAVIQYPNLAYAFTALTPKGRVTANEWSGPQAQPIKPIHHESYARPPSEFRFGDSTPRQLMQPFRQRADGYPSHIKIPLIEGQLKALPAKYSPWWNAMINRPMRTDLPSLPVNAESLILNAIEHSPQISALRIDPVLRETVIIEEEAEFDWNAFVEATYDDNNDPVGNSLTVGANGGDRFKDRNISSRAGVRKRLDQGGEFGVSQRLGYQNTNSTFFIPDRQGTTRLEVNFTQPLLRGAGTIYNESRIVLATIDRNSSEDELSGRLQDHLVDVYTTYWALYRARAVRLQKQRLLQRAMEIEQHLKARQGVDAIRRQVLRAAAAVASRRSEIVRADMAIRNAESRLRLLVNSPDLKQQAQVELLPDELPLSEHLNISLKASIETALQNRPDVARAIRRMKSTSVRLGIARNELLPKLDFVLGAYVAGLEGNRKVPEAFQNQFSEGRPGFSVGFLMEIPLGNRAARARNERRQWEVARAFREFEAAVEIGMTDVELAVRELETSYQEMLSRFQAMIAAETEANYLMERWRLLPGSDQTISFLLEDLLDAQERVADEEAAFVNAQSNYVLSIVELKRATGVLLDCESSPAAANETRRRPARPQADSPNPRTRAVPESSIPMPAGPATSRPRPVRQPVPAIRPGTPRANQPLRIPPPPTPADRVQPRPRLPRN